MFSCCHSRTGSDAPLRDPLGGELKPNPCGFPPARE